MIRGIRVADRNGVAMPCLAVCCLVFAGCAVAPLTQRVNQFGGAVGTIVPPVTHAYETVEETYYDGQVAALVVNYDKNGFNPEKIQPFLSREDLLIRTRVLDGLQAYADALRAVTSDKASDALDAATTSVGQSVLGLQKEGVLSKAFAKNVPEDAINLATAALNTLGHFLVERKRSRRLSTIIGEMQEPIRQLGNLLIADIGSAPDAQGHGGKGLRNQLWLAYDKLVEDQDAFIAHSTLDPVERRQEIAKLPALARAQREADLTLQATQETVRKLVAAHQALATKDDTRMRDGIAALMAEGKRVAAYYQGLQAHRE